MYTLLSSERSDPVLSNVPQFNFGAFAALSKLFSFQALAGSCVAATLCAEDSLTSNIHLLDCAHMVNFVHHFHKKIRSTSNPHWDTIKMNCALDGRGFSDLIHCRKCDAISLV